MTFTLRSAADILGNITPMLGFVPTDSIVLYLLRTGGSETTVVSIARIDVDSPIAATTAAIRDLNLHRMGVDAVIIAAICERQDPHAADLITHLDQAVTDTGAIVLRRLQTTQLDQPGQWTDIDTGDTGATYDYRESAAAAEHVHQGYVITASRKDIEREFEPDDAAPPVAAGNHDLLVTTTFAHTTQALAGLRHITPTLAAQCGVVITLSKHLRDQMLALSCEDPREGADLWTTVARHLRNEERIEALTLAAFTHYAASDAVRAGIALDAAQRTASESRQPVGDLAQLLGAAIRAGISPQQVRDMIAIIAE
jgi:hypothetical protein